jgi:hypothetical protein
MPESGSCADVKDADVAYGTGLTGGWTKAGSRGSIRPWVLTGNASVAGPVVGHLSTPAGLLGDLAIGEDKMADSDQGCTGGSTPPLATFESHCSATTI